MSNLKHNNCDLQSLSEYVAGGLPESIPEELDRHLEVCETCRNELATRAAEPELWQEAVELLKPRNSTPDLHLSYAKTDGYLNDARMETDTQKETSPSRSSIVDWLAPTDDPEMLGRVGEYEVSGVVGVGGMGSVLKGFDRSLLRVVAIKVMAPHLADSGTARSRFEREARAAAAINHDNVVAIYRVAEANALPYLVMPFARGPSLQKRIQESGPLSTIEVCRVGRQIAAGLAAAHEQGLVHRDIKPANILLNDCLERILITDFGLARAMDDVSMTQTGVIAGTPQYMSPEQARGDSIDHRSDLFSLGAVLYTACTGRPPFRAEAAYGILRRITDTEPRPIQELNPDVPLWLCTLVDRLLAKHPSDRFQSAQEVAELFENCIGHLQQPAQISLPNCLLQPPTKPITPKPKSIKPQLDRKPFFKKGILFMASIFLLFAAALGAIQITSAPDVSGTWSGEVWPAIQIKSVEEAENWYSGKFVEQDGNTGVLHLEWSRWDRRFNGRWTQGEDRSGSISLRRGNGSTLRGAILVDSNGNRNSNSANLRDFVWNQSSANEAKLAFHEQPVDTKKNSTKREPFDGTVVSSSKGTVVFVSPNLKIGAQLKRGDFLLELETGLKEMPKALLNEVEDLKEQAKSAAQNLESKKEKHRLLTRERDFAMKKSMQKRVMAVGLEMTKKEAMLESLEAKVAEARLNFDQQKKLADKNFVSNSQVAKSKSELSLANSNLEAAKQEIASIQNEMELLEAELQQELIQIDLSINEANAERQDAENALKSLQRKIVRLEQTIASVDRKKFMMPMDGTIVAIGTNCRPGGVVSQHEMLVTIESPKAQTKNGSGSKWSPSQRDPAAAGTPNLSTAAGDLGDMRISFDTLSELDKRIRNARQEVAHYENLEDSRLELADSQSRLNMAVAQLETIEKLFELKLASAQNRAKMAVQKLETARRGYEMGSLPAFELMDHESRAEEAKSKVAQFQLLLDFCNKIGGK